MYKNLPITGGEPVPGVGGKNLPAIKQTLQPLASVTVSIANVPEGPEGRGRVGKLRLAREAVTSSNVAEGPEKPGADIGSGIGTQPRVASLSKYEGRKASCWKTESSPLSIHGKRPKGVVNALASGSMIQLILLADFG